MRPCCAGIRSASSASLLRPFASVEIIPERFPVKSRLHKGWKGMAFNTLFVGHLQCAAPRVGAQIRVAPDGVRPEGGRVMAATFVKAHAYGNDFLMVPEAEVAAVDGLPEFARRVCDRHRGHRRRRADAHARDARRCGDAAAQRRRQPVGDLRQRAPVSRGIDSRAIAGWRPAREIVIDTDAGPKPLALLDVSGACYRFRAAMGPPEQLREETIEVDGEPVRAIVLRVGNPQCVVLGPVTQARLETIAARLAVHPFFPEGTNVELATVESPDRVRILIWERGVGPTEASGTGACAAAVAAAAYGGAARSVEVISPGGTQHVEWTDRRDLADRLGGDRRRRGQFAHIAESAHAARPRAADFCIPVISSSSRTGSSAGGSSLRNASTTGVSVATTRWYSLLAEPCARFLQGRCQRCAARRAADRPRRGGPLPGRQADRRAFAGLERASSSAARRSAWLAELGLLVAGLLDGLVGPVAGLERVVEREPIVALRHGLVVFLERGFGGVQRLRRVRRGVGFPGRLQGAFGLLTFFVGRIGARDQSRRGRTARTRKRANIESEYSASALKCR